MALATETTHPFEFMISEEPAKFCREKVTILAGSGSSRVLTAGMVLGARISGTGAVVAGGTNTGNGVLDAIVITSAAMDGDYHVVNLETVAALGNFEVRDPNGVTLGTVVVGNSFSGGGLAFDIADGAADFVAGDFFTITVTQTSKKFLQFAEAATTGEQNVAGILGADITALNAVDNLGGVAIVRGNAIVKSGEITFPTGISAADKTDAIQALEALGILVR